MARIVKFGDDLIGKEVWYLDPFTGAQHFTVTGIYHTNSSTKKDRWGLFRDIESNKNKNAYSKIFWPREAPVFDSKGALVRYFNKLLALDDLEALRDDGIDLRVKR